MTPVRLKPAVSRSRVKHSITEPLPSLGILSLFSNEFNKFNNTGAGMLDSIYHMTLNLLNQIFGMKTS